MARKARSRGGNVNRGRVEVSRSGGQVKIVGAVPKSGHLKGKKARIWGDDEDVRRLRSRLYG